MAMKRTERYLDICNSALGTIFEQLDENGFDPDDFTVEIRVTNNEFNETFKIES